ncbi:MAG TPA: hypothetical protein VGZ00_04245 [Candidatus Baltobacteraceae bacterium]|jgi:hypothetical protein|nr:hypothetical protein [Candidatus Baltobacteraceae bacterium]
MKVALRATVARMTQALDAALTSALAGMTSNDIWGWIHHCAYDPKSNPDVL